MLRSTGALPLPEAAATPELRPDPSTAPDEPPALWLGGVTAPSPPTGIHTWHPSQTGAARLRRPGWAPAVIPPATSMASATRALGLTVYTPGCFTRPAT